MKKKFGFVGIIAGLNLLSDWKAIHMFAKLMAEQGFPRICVPVDPSLDVTEFKTRVDELKALDLEVTAVSVGGEGQFCGSATESEREAFVQAKTAELQFCEAVGISATGGPWMWPWLNLGTTLTEDELVAYEERAVQSLVTVAKAVPGVKIMLEAVSPHETPYFYKSVDVRRVVKACRVAGADNLFQLVDICHLTTSGEVTVGDISSLDAWLPEAISEGAVGLVHFSAARFRGNLTYAVQPTKEFAAYLEEHGYDGPMDLELFLPGGVVAGLLGIFVNTYDVADDELATFEMIASGTRSEEDGLEFATEVVQAHRDSAYFVFGE